MNVAAILKLKGRTVVTITADKSLLEVAKLLVQHGIGCIVMMVRSRASCRSATSCGRSANLEPKF